MGAPKTLYGETHIDAYDTMRLLGRYDMGHTENAIRGKLPYLAISHPNINVSDTIRVSYTYGFLQTLFWGGGDY